MSTPFSGIITPQSMSFTTPDGKVHNVTQAHTNYEAIKETIKSLQKALKAGEPDEADHYHNVLTELVDIGQKITAQGEGRVTVENGVVLYEGAPVHNSVTARILWGLDEGFDMTAYMRFLDDLMLNPSNRAVEEVYGFIEANSMGITEDGAILAYKRVRDDFKDLWTGKFDNTPGQIVKMRRNAVNDNKDVTCSHGLHVAAMSYLPHYGAGAGNTIVIVKVWPRNFVSIPTDYKNAKARVCEYEVLAEYDGDDKEDYLATRAIWSNDEWNDAEDDDERDAWYGDDEDEQDEDPLVSAEEELREAEANVDYYTDLREEAEERHGVNSTAAAKVRSQLDAARDVLRDARERCAEISGVPVEVGPADLWVKTAEPVTPAAPKVEDGLVSGQTAKEVADQFRRLADHIETKGKLPGE